MNVEDHPIPPHIICEGCLSTDRQLTPIYDVDEIKLFIEFLETVCHINQQLSLCWECRARIQQSVRLKRQVKEAHDILVKYMLSQIKDVTTLSQLNTSKVNHTTHEIKYNIDQPATQILSNSTSDDNQLAVVKIEEINDFDGDFYDDGGLDKDDGYLEDISKLDIKTFQNDIPIEKIKSKSKRRKKEKTVEEFDESDEEPLNVKKQKDTEVASSEKKIKKKKKKDGSRGRAERAAGVVRSARAQAALAGLGVPEGRLEMVLLSWEEVENERQKALQSAQFTRHTYRCDNCAIGFNHRSKKDNHMKKHEQTPGSLECSACHVWCRDANALSAHRRRHRVRWRCVSCGALWSRAAVAADHLSRAHAAAPPAHACRLCARTEPSLAKLRNHIRSHAERQKCELCGKTFRDRTSLKSHLFIHKGEKEYACPSCDKRFLFKKAMEVHLITHDAPAQLYCYDCDMNFKNRMSYYQHMKYNLKHIDPAKLIHSCVACDKRFAKAARLREHVIAVHLKTNPVRCAVPGCAFACASAGALRNHSRAAHRPAHPAHPAHRAARARNHVCHTCGKAYTTKKTLEGHIRSHTGERPFTCTLCPSSFGYQAALYNHNKLVHREGKTSRSRVQKTALSQNLDSTVPQAPVLQTTVPQATVPLQASVWQSALNVSHLALRSVSDVT